MPALPDLDETSITATFDCLVEDGVIIYNDNFRTVPYTDQGFSFEFRLLAGLSQKPTPTSPPQSASRCRPGSDIDVTGYEVAELGTTHLVAFNKFSAARPHLLVLTQDGFTRQHEPLNLADITALHTALTFLQEGSKRRYLAIFNCGIDSGCSRLHKHMQVFPAAPDPVETAGSVVHESFPLWPDAEDLAAVHKKLPFLCHVHRFTQEDGLPSPEALMKIYRRLVRLAAGHLLAYHGYMPEECIVPFSTKSETGVPQIPHNVILDRRWMVVVPRRKAGVMEADANAAAFLGMLWVSDEEKMKHWTEQGPAAVLGEVGLPRDTGYRPFEESDGN